MRGLRTALWIAAGCALLATGLLFPAAASAASPSWRISIGSYPTNFSANDSLSEGNLPEYAVALSNVGAAPARAIRP